MYDNDIAVDLLLGFKVMPKLTRDEKYIARCFFKLKIHESNGAAFETLFTAIMSYAEPEFRQIKPWGSIGDRKNDGYIASRGIFYQVYAPEKPEESYPKVIEKLGADFNGLVKQWPNVHEFYFVFNDKYLGINPDASATIDAIGGQYNLKKTGFILASHLEDVLFGLSDDQIQMIVGGIPDPAKLHTINYSIINEIIEKIKNFPCEDDDSNLIVPDWEKKIVFNNLSASVGMRLGNGSLFLGKLNEYLNNQSKFTADDIRSRLRELYNTEKKHQHYQGDVLFWRMVKLLVPQNTKEFQEAAIVILAKYFETCDVFEEPVEEVQQ